MKNLVIWVIRKRLGLKKGERFQFTNQKSALNYYYFTKDTLMKVHFGGEVVHRPSTVSLNFLLSDEVEIVRLGHETD